MTEAQYTEYFKSLAMEHVSVLHHDDTNKVFIDNPNEFDEKTMVPGKPYIFCSPPGTRFTASSVDSAVKNKYGELYILIGCEKNNNQQQRDSREACAQIAEDFLSRMIKDRSQQPHMIKSIDPNLCKIDPAGPLLGNAFGACMQFVIGDQANLYFNELKWN